MTARTDSPRVRLLPCLAAVCLLSLPARAQYSGGRGTADDPYQIATAADLIALGETPADSGKHFLLTADIDLAPYLPGRKIFDKAVIAPRVDDDLLNPPGADFTGTFDGKGHTIRNLVISGGTPGHLGLFGQVGDGGQVRNVCLGNVDITGASRSSCLGSLAGANYGGVIDSCYAIGTVAGGEASTKIGGLVGHNEGTITCSYAGGSVFAGNNSRFTGGLVGWNSGQIAQCYANVAIFGLEISTQLGGLVGCDVNREYDNHLSDCFWNVETAGLSESDGGIGLTAAQMRDPDTFIRAGWDFGGKPDDSSGIWAQPVGGGFPILWWQLPEPQRGPLPNFSGGTGDANDPYLISTAGALNRISGNPRLLKACFKLLADIDLKDIELPSIGSEVAPFTGVFDGNGHTISNFTCVSTDTAYTGLFGYVDGLQAQIRNLGLTAPQVETEAARGVGALVGRLNAGTIANCYVQDGNVAGRSYLRKQEGEIYGGQSTVGGLVGVNNGTVIDCHAADSVFGSYSAGGLAGMSTGTIANCTSSGNVSGSMCVGGLLGTNEANGEVAACSSTGNVLAIYLFAPAPREVRGPWHPEPRGLRAGGLVGDNTARIINSCAGGDVSGSDVAGGLVGSNGYIQNWDLYYEMPGEIINSYSTGAVSGTSNVGGLVGRQVIGPVISCFWDVQTSGRATSAAGEGKTTQQMRDIQTYLDAGWDFVGEIRNGIREVWQMPQDGGYPILARLHGYTSAQLRGSGTRDDPYLISNVMELGAVAHYSPSAHYRLTAPLDLSGIAWTAAVIPRLSGGFEGAGHTVSHLTIHGTNHLGFFGLVGSGAEVKNLGIVDVNIVGSGQYIGALAAFSGGAVMGCYSTGTVSSSYTGEHSCIGGLIGSGAGAVTQCYSTGAVNSTGWSVGGLVGDNSAALSQCYSTGAVSGVNNVGGLVGRTFSDSGTACFWDTETSGQASSAVGTGKTTAQMHTARTFLDAGWDFIGETANGTEDIWWIDEGQDYPRLWWELEGTGR